MKKIMFNDKYGLTKAVLDGNKTQTRRIINPKSYYGQPVSKIDIRINPIGEYQIYFYDDEGCEFDTDLLVPKYTVGEVVAIAQSYKDVVKNRNEAEEVLGYYSVNEELLTMEEMNAGWKNKMFVKAEYMPHQIKITNVTIERLQNISNDDCLMEGIKIISEDPNDILFYAYSYDGKTGFHTPREAFASLIDKISVGTWERNPFVWVYTFDLIK